MRRCAVLWSVPLVLLGCARVPEYDAVPKIDAHVHIDTFDSAFVTLARAEGFRLMTLVTRSAEREHVDRELAWAQSQRDRFPETVSFATTISMEHWSDPDWPQRTIDRLRRDFENGAGAVKLWKDIGMTFRRPDGTFIMIDDPRFDPVLDYIASRGKTLVGHFGEPRNCWLPLDAMTVPGDSSYFADNPQYHMYLHPEYPSYADQIDARDRMLAKHPDLTFVGAHLGSLEWSVGELAARLDRFPNMAVDLAARVSHLQIQDREAVRQFFLAHQDRLLYATDAGVSEGSETPAWIAERWRRDWRYFATDDTLTSPEVRTTFVGLKLPARVLRKLYAGNAERWLGM